MEPSLWAGDDLDITHKWFHVEANNYKVKFNVAPYHATLLFCLIYLTPGEIPVWVASIARIKGEWWQLLISDWLDSTYKTFYTDRGIMRKEILASKKPGGLAWWESFIKYGIYGSNNLYDYISQENICAFWEAVNSHPELSYEKR
jgi:hypothetical protein